MGIFLCTPIKTESNQETESLLCFGLISFPEAGGLAYLLRRPGLRDCTGPHSSLPVRGTAEGVLRAHNIHTSRFKVSLVWFYVGGGVERMDSLP